MDRAPPSHWPTPRCLVAGLALLVAAGVGCGGDAPEPMTGTFDFAVLGDAPYNGIEERKFDRVVEQLNAEDLAWVIHVGDILWYPCSDASFQSRLATFQTVRHPFIYTPGDNEWTDCHGRREGRYAPLERLDALRRIFFADPAHSLGGAPLALISQSEDAAWPEFAENGRWTRAGIVFATVHLVGSWNGFGQYEGRVPADDAEATRRTEAATAWLTRTFEVAEELDARGVVLVTHAAMAISEPPGHPYRQVFEPFLERLEVEVERFGRPVLLIHGDDHEFVIDRPLVRRTTGRALANFTRLEVYGSPDVGWVRVTVDTLAPELFRFAGQRIPMWQIW